MTIVFWLLVALTTFLAGVAILTSTSGYRILLASCFAIGMTPLGFMEGAGFPLYLPELIICVLAAAIVLINRNSIPSIKVSWFLVAFIAYFGIQVLFAAFRESLTIIDLIRSARPISFVFLLLLLSSVLQQSSVRQYVSESWLAISIASFLAADIVFYLAAQNGVMPIAGISGEFFQRTGLVRYADLLTITVFGVANYMLFASERGPRGLFWLAVCAVVVVLSMNRIFAIGFIIAFSWWLHVSVRKRVRIPGFSYVAALTPIAAFVSAGIMFARSQPGADEVISRATELFDLPLLISALKYRFVDPALAGGYELTAFTAVFGEGIGLRFYVPWFEYRGLDPWHFSVDSLLAFSFFKFGIAGVFLFFASISKLIWNRPWDISNAWIWLYLIVHSGVNVPGFLLFLLVLVVLRDGSWILVRDDTRHASLSAPVRA